MGIPLSSCLMDIAGSVPSRVPEADEFMEAVVDPWVRLPRGAPPLPAAVMLACSEVSSDIICSFCSALSAWTVCACCRRLSSRENCLPQWQVNGLSPVCFL